MAGNSILTDVDVAQIIGKIRSEIEHRSEKQQVRGGMPETLNVDHNASSDLTAELSVLDRELDALNAQLKDGEPMPPSQSLRGRFGSVVKERLYRFLWWQSDQIQSLVRIAQRRGHEETKLLDAMTRRTGLLEMQVRQALNLASDFSRRTQEFQRRLQELEAAQLRLQAGEIERNVRERAALPSQQSSPSDKHNELESRFASAITAHSQKIDDVTQQLNTERSERDKTTRVLEHLQGEILELNQKFAEVANLVEAGGVAREELGTRLRDLGSQVEEGALSKENLLSQINGLSQRIDAAQGQREQLSSRLSQLGLFTHQTRSSLSIQDRRLSLFMEEARKRLPDSFTNDDVRSLTRSHSDHRYDSLYRLFEDVFRGSRQEIKARQGIYLPFLRDRGIGSTTMPILDLGCGRGEWLELLGEENLVAMGVDQNDAMIEQCQAAGIKATQGDAIAYLGSLSDASVGAITSFHMIEHLPFDMILHLVDEALRVLKPGGVLILETPNPHNVLVGATTFYLDPTHLKPLPSPMVRFFVEARGFNEANVWELQPYPESARLPEEDQYGIGNRLNAYLYGPQDYAVVGVRP